MDDGEVAVAAKSAALGAVKVKAGRLRCKRTSIRAAPAASNEPSRAGWDKSLTVSANHKLAAETTNAKRMSVNAFPARGIFIKTKAPRSVRPAPTKITKDWAMEPTMSVWAAPSRLNAYRFPLAPLRTSAIPNQPLGSIAGCVGRRTQNTGSGRQRNSAEYPD